MPRKSVRCAVCKSVTSKLTTTECCNNWVCDGKCSCLWGHERYSSCYYHHNEGHEGERQNCEDDLCRDGGEYEISEEEEKSSDEDESPSSPTSHPTCALCGDETNEITTTECCNNWVCDGKGGCLWHHERYSGCYFHHNEGHKGSRQACEDEICREGGDYEISEKEDSPSPESKKGKKRKAENGLTEAKKPRKEDGESSENSEELSTDIVETSADEEESSEEHEESDETEV